MSDDCFLEMCVEARGKIMRVCFIYGGVLDKIDDYIVRCGNLFLMSMNKFYKYLYYALREKNEGYGPIRKKPKQSDCEYWFDRLQNDVRSQCFEEVLDYVISGICILDKNSMNKIESSLPSTESELENLLKITMYAPLRQTIHSKLCHIGAHKPYGELNECVFCGYCSK